MIHLFSLTGKIKYDLQSANINEAGAGSVGGVCCLRKTGLNKKKKIKTFKQKKAPKNPHLPKPPQNQKTPTNTKKNTHQQKNQ